MIKDKSTNSTCYKESWSIQAELRPSKLMVILRLCRIAKFNIKIGNFKPLLCILNWIIWAHTYYFETMDLHHNCIILQCKGLCHFNAVKRLPNVHWNNIHFKYKKCHLNYSINYFHIFHYLFVYRKFHDQHYYLK